MARQDATTPMSRQAAWVVGCRVVGIVATLATNIAAARLLGPAGFGVYVLITAVIAFGSLVAMAGLNEAGLRFVSEQLARQDYRAAKAYLLRVFQLLAVTSLLAGSVVAAAMAAYFALAGQTPESWVILVASSGVVVLAFQQVSAELLRGYDDVRRASLFSGGQTGGPLSNVLLLAALGVAAFLAVDLTSTSAVVLTVASIVATAPLALWMIARVSAVSANSRSRDVAHTNLSAAENRQLLAVAVVLMFNQLLAFGVYQLDIWLGGVTLTSADLGLYGAAKRSLLLAAMPVQMAAMTILPSIPRLHSQGQSDDLQQLLRNSTTLAAIPSAAALIALAVFPVPILETVFGGQFAGAAPTVMVLCAGYLVLALTGNAPAVLAMTGHHRTVLVVNLLAAVVLLVGGTLGAFAYGAAGLAAGAAASMAFQNGLLWWLTRKQVGVWTHIGRLRQGRNLSAETDIYCEADLSNRRLALQNR